MNDRASGWKHAKISGHENEKNLAEILGEEYQPFSKKVPSIFGDLTTPKKDLTGPTNISIKKSKGGQVFLTPTPKFISAYEKIYTEIPQSVKDCLLLLFGGHENISDIQKNVTHADEKIFQTERKRRTLCVESIRMYNEKLLDDCIEWFQNNMYSITEIVFQRGYASNTKDFANILLYKNTLGENDLNSTFNMEDLKVKCSEKSLVYFGDKNGGTTINLPFGHAQYHQGMIQFHHNYEKIKNLFES